jgi:signal transduction histidine kinase
MPDAIRATGGRLSAHPRRDGFLSCGAALIALVPCGARADDAIPRSFHLYLNALTSLDRHEIAALVLVLGILLFAVVTAIMLVRARRRAAATEARLRDQLVALKTEADRFNALLLSEPQILVSWAAADDAPEIRGDVSLVTSTALPQRVLAFGSWLEPYHAQAMERAVDALRAQGEGFAMPLMTLGGRAIEAEARAIGGQAVLRLRDISGLKRELAELGARHDRLSNEGESLRALIEALPAPAWMRDVAGALVYVNPAYARAVEARDATEVVGRSLELLGRATRAEASQTCGAGKPFAARVPAIVAGGRCTLDVLDIPTRNGSVGLGIDVTEVEALRSEIGRLGDAHRQTLDQVATGVAIFGGDQRLSFYNTAYRSLWGLDSGFLEQSPTDSAVLDQLRAQRKLPEEQDFRLWKATLHEAYRATEAREQLWHLPDRRTLRVVTTPNPQGGVTYLFEDVTERLELVRRYDAMIRVQRETLDNLAEAVAVFGSDGRVRLYNPAFAQMWKLSSSMLNERPHIETVIGWLRPLHGDEVLWRKLRAAVTAIEGRDPVAGRLERKDGSVLDLVTVPLPDGATLVTFLDVTDTVNVERALRERNEALVAADALKVDFVHHVSYELRSPLTNIIGFAHFLGEPSTGPMTEKQREYLGYINTSTNALLAIINDILDLATIDAGAMKLNLGPVDIRRTMDAAAEGIKDRLVKDGLSLQISAATNVGNFVADERRVRQILFNLLANAVGFSPTGTAIVLAAERRPDAIVLSVTDNGPGIPTDMKDRVFDWFETHPLGSRHRGAGLGLSIVRSFVELHGGTVTLESAVGHGTTVTCTFPIECRIERSAA